MYVCVHRHSIRDVGRYSHEWRHPVIEITSNISHGDNIQHVDNRFDKSNIQIVDSTKPATGATKRSHKSTKESKHNVTASPQILVMCVCVRVCVCVCVCVCACACVCVCAHTHVHAREHVYMCASVRSHVMHTRRLGS